MSGASEREPNFLAISFIFVAAGLLIITGAIAFFYGIFSLGTSSGRSTDVPVYVSPEVWNFLRIFGGSLLVFAGFNLIAGRTWARAFGVGVAAIVILACLVWIGDYPVFSLGLLAANLVIIWALWRHGTEHMI